MGVRARIDARWADPLLVIAAGCPCAKAAIMIEASVKPKQDPSTEAVTAVCSAMPITRDAAVLVGELFRRLTLANEVFPEGAFGRIVSAIHVALGRAVLEEAERRARILSERAEPTRSRVRSRPGGRRIDFDGGWDIEGEK